MEIIPAGNPRMRLKVPQSRVGFDPRPSASAAFRGASWTHPDVRNWAPSIGSADADILPELATLRRRTRDLTRNHGLASGALQTQLDNVLGCGLWLAPTPDYTMLGKDAKWATTWRRPVKAMWRSWAETTLCDAGESLTLDGQATQIFSGAWQNGDGLALSLWLPKPGYASTRLQVIESDRLSNPMDAPDGWRQPDWPDAWSMRGGVLIDEYGAPQAFAIRQAHPGDRFIFGYDQLAMYRWVLVSAKTPWGRRRVIHAHDKGRAGQTRGVPAIAAVLSRFKVLGDYQRAELKSAVVNAMVSMVTKSAIGQEGLVELLSGNSDALSDYMDGLSSRGRSAIDYSEGMIVPLAMGEDLASFTPGRPSSAYDPFVTSIIREMAAGLNLPYELLAKDFSKVNYSSARAALLEAWRFFTGRRDWMARSFYQPAYELWFEEMVAAGEIDAPDYREALDAAAQGRLVPELAKLRAAYTRARWIGPGRGWVDPLKEVQAAELRMDIFVSTLEDECAEQGKDYEEVLEQIAEEQARIKELGIERIVAKGVAPKGATDPQETPTVQDVGVGARISELAESVRALADRPIQVLAPEKKPVQYLFETDAEGRTIARPTEIPAAPIHVTVPVHFAEGAIAAKVDATVHAHMQRSASINFQEDADGKLTGAELVER